MLRRERSELIRYHFWIALVVFPAKYVPWIQSLRGSKGHRLRRLFHEDVCWPNSSWRQTVGANLLIATLERSSPEHDLSIDCCCEIVDIKTVTLPSIRREFDKVSISVTLQTNLYVIRYSRRSERLPCMELMSLAMVWLKRSSPCLSSSEIAVTLKLRYTLISPGTQVCQGNL
jgi:hypothetical protein